MSSNQQPIDVIWLNKPEITERTAVLDGIQVKTEIVEKIIAEAKDIQTEAALAVKKVQFNMKDARDFLKFSKDIIDDNVFTVSQNIPPQLAYGATASII